MLSMAWTSMRAAMSGGLGVAEEVAAGNPISTAIRLRQVQIPPVDWLSVHTILTNAAFPFLTSHLHHRT
jgi:hypothetical protein